MRKALGVAGATLGLVAIGLGAPAQAAQTELGTPGKKNCHGQTLAYIAQELRDVDWGNYHGLGGYVRYQNSFDLNWTVEDVRDAAEWWCSGAGS